MSKAPAFQWYPKDCDTDENVRAMSDAEFGFYMRCLNHAWLNEGLPADLAELGRIMGRTTAYVKKAWGRVGRCFELRDGRYWNPKQESQRATARQFVDSRRKAAEARWGKNGVHVDGSCNARASDMQCSPNNGVGEAEAVGIIKPGIVKTVFAADLNGQTSQKFLEWWELWSKVRGTFKKSAACQAYISVVSVELEPECFACTASYLAGLEAPNRGYNPDNFLFEMARDGFQARWPERKKTRAEALDALLSEDGNGQ